jgi:3-hydroxyacyl-CoA dehydrogenase/enoyl-CoA hydratase/carnithine racemase
VSQSATPHLDFPDEIVTRSLVRYVRLPLDAGTAALITLDNGHDHTKPSTWGPAGLAGLDAALDEVSARDDLVAVCLTGKPFIFSVGADLKALRAMRTIDDVREIGRLGHRVLGRLSTLPVPTFAFVNGAAMGGGLETALNCTYRTVSTGAAALALPEVFLGLIPGWGGAYLLPNLIGIEAAVTVVLANPLANNRMLKPREALAIGVADAMFEPADFVEQSLTWAAQVVRGDVVVSRNPVDRESTVWQAALDRGRAAADAKTHGTAPAPYRALQLLEGARTSSRADAFAAEDEALAELAVGPELAASLYSFDLVQKRAKRPVGVPAAAPRPITKVGVVGAGLMASQLALLFARRLQVPVHLTDLDEERVARGVGWVHAEIDTLAGKGRLSPDAANRLRALVTGSTDVGDFADADLVIEAVFEQLDVKQQVLGELEAVVAPSCILATNTSSLSVAAMATKLQHPERVVGLHFFNPVGVMPLLEVVRAARTDDETLATAFAVAKQLKKSAVMVSDSPAFVVNRVLARFLGEVNACVDEGTPLEVVDAAVAPLGLPMSPFVLLGLVGPAVAQHVAQTMHDAFPDRFHVSPNMSRLVTAGKPGVYLWDGSTPRVDPEVLALFEAGDHPSTSEQVLARTSAAIADELARMLDEGVVGAVQDIDLCLLLGAGWPFWDGGISAYLDRTGVAEGTNGRRFHEGPLRATA